MAAILAAHDQQGHAGVTSLAIALNARLDEVEAVTPGERLLISELLSRLSAAG
ncbi:hypothetical protein [Sphingomonas sp. NFX23]|uniref:hypothetical protein n=1 Tax=Sphingomonas sp. NFX23 TaxID=2819532 RepID=UPI003CEC5266